MKRILSLVLVLALVLGSVPVAFAAEDTAGEQLKAAGFVAGDQDGNLNEDQKLTREQMMVLIAEMNGVKDEAATFGIPADFSDVNENDWFAPYVWYAFYQGWTAGMGDGSFGAGVAVDSKMAASFMLKALDYEVADYNASVAQATDLGIEITETAGMTRGEGFTAMLSTVKLPKQGSEVALGVELGKMEAEEETVESDLPTELDEAKALGNTVVEVEFVGDVAAATASDFTIVEKNDATKEIEVVDVIEVSGDKVYLETAALKEGTAYSVVIGEGTLNFTGIDKEKDAPEVDSVKGTDTGVVEVKFDMNVDRVSATDITKYSIDKEGTVVAAEMDDDDVVLLTVEGFVTKTSKKLTVENVLSIDGVKMVKEVKTFSPDFDTKAPKIDDVIKSNKNNVEVIIDFDDKHGVDKTTAEDVSNYSIDGLEVVSAKATYIDEDDQDTYYDRVILTTSEQTKSKKYTVKVLKMIDGSEAANATTKVLEEDFRGGVADEDEPNPKSVSFRNMTEVEVVVSEENALDATTALDASNYTFEDDELTVVDVRFDDEDENGNTYQNEGSTFAGNESDDIKIILTVSGVEENTKYTLFVDNLVDNFNNEMDDDEKFSNFKVSTEIKIASPIKSIKTEDLDTINVVFDSSYGDIDEATAEDATNYEIDGLGFATKATLQDDDVTVKLEIPEMNSGKKYEIIVNNVKNLWGYAAEDVTKEFVANPDELDEEQPEVDSVDFADKGILTVTFSEVMDNTFVSNKTILVNTSATTTNAITLTAVDVDEETIVFDARNGEGTGTNAPIKKDTEYEIVGFGSTVTDLGGNKVDYDYDGGEDFDTDDETFDASEDAVEVSSIDQEDGRTINVYFDEDVKVATTSITVSGMTFELEVDDDEDTLVTATLTSGTFDDDEKELAFDFSSNVTDIVNRPVKVETVKVDVEYDDDDGPVLDELKIIDNETIKLYFDEPLKTPGSWKLIYDDEDGDEKTVSLSDDGFDLGEDVVKLITGDELDSDFDYTLQIKTEPKDLAGNKYEDEDDEWSFSGVDNEPEADFVGFQILNATQAKIFDGYDGTEVVTVAMTNNTNFAKNDDYFLTFDSDSEAWIVDLATGSNMTWVFDTNSSFTATVDGADSQTATGLLERDDISSDDVATSSADSGTVVVEMQDWSEDSDITETYGLYEVTKSSTKVTDYALISSTATLDGTDEITFTGATLTANKVYVAVVYNADGEVVAVSKEYIEK